MGTFFIKKNIQRTLIKRNNVYTIKNKSSCRIIGRRINSVKNEWEFCTLSTIDNSVLVLAKKYFNFE